MKASCSPGLGPPLDFRKTLTIIDDLVKSRESRRSRAGGSPEFLDLTSGFRENDEDGVKTTFYETVKI
jgi:hypothetical protein